MDHDLFHFSVTVSTDDRVVLSCLRAICEASETHGKRQIAWGGTGIEEWERDKRTVTFRFTKPEYRVIFINDAARLLGGRWALISTRDDDPATPQRHN